MVSQKNGRVIRRELERYDWVGSGYADEIDYIDAESLEAVVCASGFQALMGKRHLPRRIILVASTTRLPGAARVPIKRYPNGEVRWYDWNGGEQELFYEAQRILCEDLEVPVGESWIWVDWKPVRRKRCLKT